MYVAMQWHGLYSEAKWATTLTNAKQKDGDKL